MPVFYIFFKTDDYFKDNPHRFTWDEAAKACNSFRGFLLYSFNVTHLMTIAESYSSELSATGLGVSQVSFNTLIRVQQNLT